MSRPVVSIVMPVHNGATYLQAALDSLRAQVFRDFELIVVDDASSDDTPALLEACRNTRLHVLRNDERLHLSGALNRGLDVAQGVYVARMDADDVAHPQRLAEQVQELGARPELGLCGTWTRHIGDGQRPFRMKYPLRSDAIRATALFNTPFAHPTVMWRRDVFERARLRFDGTYYPTEDFELWVRALRICEAVNLPRVLLDYRVHAASLTGARWEEMDAQAARVCRPQLKALGMASDDVSARFHRRIAQPRFDFTPADRRRAARWIGGLAAANRRVGWYVHGALMDVLYERWWTVCMHAAEGPRGGLRDYLRDDVGRRDPKRAWRLAVLAASALRRGTRGANDTDESAG